MSKHSFLRSSHVDQKVEVQTVPVLVPQETGPENRPQGLPSKLQIKKREWSDLQGSSSTVVNFRR